MNNEKYVQSFSGNMYNYKNVFNPATGFMEGKDSAGNWKELSYRMGGPFTEGNAWHWVWSVFHDINGLIH